MSIIEELQRACIDSNANICDLLRKALIVSSKLELSEFKNWINYELQGYPAGSTDIPAYRAIRGHIKWRTPYGHEGFMNLDELPDIKYDIETKPFEIPVSSILEFSKLEGEQINRSLDGKISQYLNSFMGYHTSLQFFVLYSPVDFKSMLHQIQTHILNWTLLLEEMGIKGQNLIFSKEEKETVKSDSIINNFYFTHIQGNIDQSQLQLGTMQSQQDKLD